MLSNEIHRKLETIRAKNGATAKQAILKTCLDDPEFKEVMVFALSPYITFGVGKKTVEECLDKAEGENINATSNFSTETWELLENLANRVLTGNAAKEAIVEELECLNPNSRDLLCDILQKDLKSGFKASTVNKVKKGLIPEYKVALAHPLKKYAHKMKYPAAVELKLDGMRLLTEVVFGESKEKSTVSFKSREGIALDFKNLESQCIDVAHKAYERLGSPKEVKGMFIDGEIEAGESFKTSMQILKKGGGDAKGLRYTVFWIQPLDLFFKQEKYPATYKTNRVFMKQVFDEPFKTIYNGELLCQITLVDSYMVGSETEANGMYAKARERNLEGVIVKDINATYDYKRTATWLKIKGHETLDLPIVDIEEGEGRLKNNLGKIIVEYKGKRVGVGSGLTDQWRKEIWDDPDSYIDEIVEVSFQEETEAGSLRHPVFEGFRTDKSKSD